MVSLSSSLSNKKAIPVSRPCNWTLMIFLLWSVMILLNTGLYISRHIRLVKPNKAKNSESHNC